MNKAPLTFPFQRKEERVILMLRRHWLVVSILVARHVVLHFVPVLLFILLFGGLGWEVPAGEIGAALLILLLSTYLLFIWVFYFHEFVDYYLDVWIVTTERIVSVEQHGLFHRKTSDIDLTRIQDVSVEMKGKAATFLNFGDVIIRSASEKEHFVFHQVRRPEEVAQVVSRLHRDIIRIQGNGSGVASHYPIASSPTPHS